MKRREALTPGKAREAMKFVGVLLVREFQAIVYIEVVFLSVLAVLPSILISSVNTYHLTIFVIGYFQEIKEENA